MCAVCHGQQGTSTRADPFAGMAHASDLHKGVRVSWNTSQGRTQGVVVRKAVRRFKIDAFEIHATKDDPRWVVQSEKTGKRAAHKASGLRLLKPHR